MVPLRQNHRKALSSQWIKRMWRRFLIEAGQKISDTIWTLKKILGKNMNRFLVPSQENLQKKARRVYKGNKRHF
ncbi:hypothetical protein ILYODFUR_034515 [Ilyodon furcidens]|uniref:Ribosomal protein L32 n=1 Tax=Ilyodon furcidens TaxID=33524 RepID=A0ABV0U0S0_9TELE